MGMNDDVNFLPSTAEILSPDVPYQEYSFGDKLGSYFETETIFGSRNLTGGKDFAPNPDWSPTKIPIGMEDYADFLGEAESQAEFDYKMGELGKIQEKRNLASQLGFFPSLLVQGLAPENMIGFTAVLSKINHASKIIEYGSKGAVGGGLGALLQETGLQHNDPTRTAIESTFGVGAGVLFGGMLGGGYGAFVNPKQLRSALVDPPDDQLSHTSSVQPIDLVDEYGQGSMGAAETFTQQKLNLEQQGLKMNPGVEKFLKLYGGMTPTLRTVMSNSKIVRLAAQKLHSYGGIFEKTKLGIATEHSVETKMADFNQRVIGGVIQNLDNAYSNLVFGRDPKTLDWIRVRFGKDKKMTKTEFYEAVTESFLTKQGTGVKQIDDAADHMHREFFQPLLERGKKVGLFGEDTGDTLEGRLYFTLVYDQDLLIDKNVANKFIGYVHDNLRQEQVNSRKSYDAFEDEIQPLKDELQLHRTALDQAIKASSVTSDSIKEKAMDVVLNAMEKTSFPQLLHPEDVNEVSVKSAYNTELRRSMRERMTEVFKKVNEDSDFKFDYDTLVKEVVQDINKASKDLKDQIDLTPDDILREKVKAGAKSGVTNVAKDYDVDVADSLLKTINKAVGDAIEAMNINLEKQFDKISKNGGKPLTPDMMAKKIQRFIDFKVKDEVAKMKRAIIKEATKDIKSQIVNTAKKIKERKKKHAIDDNILNLTDEELRENAANMLERIRGTPFGSMPYNADDFKFLRGKTGGFKFGKKRTNYLTHEQKKEFIIKNPEQVMNIYGRQTMAEIVLRESGLVSSKDSDFIELMSKDESLEGVINAGDPSGAKLIYDIYQDYNRMIDHGRQNNKSQKYLEGLKKERDTAMKDVKAMIDIARGVYKLPDDPLSWTHRAKNAMMDFTYVTRLGGMTISSLTDPGKIVMTHGFANTFNYVLKPIVANMKGFKMTLKDARESVGVLEHIVSSRIMSTADIVTDFHRHSKAERLLGAATDKFGKIAFMTQWNSIMKQVTSGIAMQKIIRQMSTGKADEVLLNLGIDDKKIPIIMDQINKYGGTVTGGKIGTTGKDELLIANINQWDDQYAANELRLAMRKHIDNTIVTPGMDKPLVLRHGIGHLAGQFQAFGFASVEKTLLPGIQNHDRMFFQGVVTQLSLGMMIYYLKSQLAGRETSDNVGTWISEGIDRSGIFGILSTMDSMMYKLSFGNLGLKSMLTGGEGDVSKYQQKSLTGVLLGPSASVVEDMVNITGGILGEDDWTEWQTKAARRMLPYSTIPWFAGIFNMMESATNNMIGVKK